MSVVTPAEFRRRYLSAGRPVVFVDAMQEWAARREWTLPWFRKRCGELSIRVRWGRRGHSTQFGEARVELGRYIDAILEPARRSELRAVSSDWLRDPPYMQNCDLTKHDPALAAHFAFPRYYACARLTRRGVWIGPAHTVAQLHCDYAHNLLAQVVGAKRIQLYAPARTPSLRPRFTTYYSSMSALDFDDVAPAVPGQGGAPDFDLILNAGEMLFLPYGWWHRVTSLEPSVSINLWWLSKRQLLLRSPVIAAGAFAEWRSRST